MHNNPFYSCTAHNRLKKSRFVFVAILVLYLSPFSLADEVWQYTYNSQNNIETADGPRTDVADITVYTYDTNRNLTGIQNAAGQVTTYADHDASGRATRIVDANNVATLLSFNDQGQLASTTLVSPDNNSNKNLLTQFEYDVLGLLTRTVLPDGTTSHYVYDTARRLEAIYNNAGERIEYAYDAAGNVVQENILDYYGSLHYEIERVYDELSRVIALQNTPDSSIDFSYDVNDNLTESVNGRDLSNSAEYDALNRLEKVIDPLLNETAISYDDQGRVASVTDARGLTTHYQYDVYGNQLLLDSPDTGITTYTYDEASNRTSMLNNGGVIAEYTYDVLNRLVTVSYPDNSAENITYQYDSVANGNFGKGRLTNITDSSGEIDFLYDFAGRLIEKNYTIAAQSYSLAFAYADNGYLTHIAYPGGREVRYTHDSVGRINAIYTRANSSAAEQLVLSGVEYLPYGPIDSFIYGNGVVQEFDYDNSYRQTSLQSSGSANILERHYSYDGNSNITAMTTEQGTNDERTLTYDDLDRIETVVKYTNSFFFDYDAVGNRLSREINEGTQQTTETYTYAIDSNRLNSIAIVDPQGSSARSFTYDDNGNVVVDNISGANTGQVTTVYSETNRPESVIANGVNVLYTHNSLGQRTAKITGATTEHYHYDESGQLIAVSNGSGDIKQNIIFLGSTPVAVLVDGGTGESQPIINISFPAPNTELEQGVSHNFNASALDETDGNISSAIQWNSSQSGVLGTGATLSVSSLPLGEHIISASVQNAAGTSGITAIRVSVVTELTDPNDLDGDGLPDIWEWFYFGVITNQDANGDADNDGLTNLQELIYESIPTAANTLASAQQNGSDSDADGLLDTWENYYFGNLEKNGADDTDGDLWNDAREFLEGTSPIDSNSGGATPEDTDADDLLDVWEIQYFGGLQYSGSDNFDGDNFNNLIEHERGFDPTVNDNQRVMMLLHQLVNYE